MSIKIDFHVHSIGSMDGRSSLEEIAARAKERGLDAVCICDHNKESLRSPRFVDGVWLLPGCEISAQKEHILAIMCEKALDIKQLRASGNPTSDAAIAMIHECGGIAVIAHPFGHPLKVEWSDEHVNLAPDAIEVYNSRAWMSCPNANEKALEYAKKKNYAMVGGSDGHLAVEVGNSYAEVDCVRIEDIKNAVLLHHVKPVFSQNAKRKYKGLSQLRRGKNSKTLRGKIRGLCIYIECSVLELLGK